MRKVPNDQTAKHDSIGTYLLLMMNKYQTHLVELKAEAGPHVA